MDERVKDIEQVADLIRGIRVAMLTTVDGDGELHGRPMGGVFRQRVERGENGLQMIEVVIVSAGAAVRLKQFGEDRLSTVRGDAEGSECAVPAGAEHGAILCQYRYA